MQNNTTFPIRLTYSHAQDHALYAIYALSGLLFSSWASRIPALQAGLGISHSMLSLVLLCGGLGAVLSYPVGAKMMEKFGARKTVLYSSLGLCLVLPSIGLAPNVTLLMLAVLMLGVTAGCFGIGLNPLAAKFEKASGKSKMARLHALGCAGSLCGALLGSLVAGMRIEPSVHFMMLAMPMACLFWLSAQVLDSDDKGEIIEKKSFSLPSRSLALLGVLGFCGAMSENSIADWSGVFLKSHFGVTEGVAPLALSAFTVMMLISRLMGDNLKEKHGARKLVCLGGAIAAMGLFTAVLAPNEYFALLGFGFAGMGLALLFPFILSAAGQQGAMAAASVATMANIGSLMGPPIIGSIADYMGMQAAMGFIGTLSIIIAVTAAKSKMLK
jgi:MFS family permease